MIDHIIPLIITASVFLGIDLLWLSLAHPIYKKYLGSLLQTPPNWKAASVLYVGLVIGMMVFVIYPCIAIKSVGSAYQLGGLYGLVTYMTYQLTNYATLKDWPLIVVIMDIVWGGIACSSAASITTWFLLRLIG